MEMGPAQIAMFPMTEGAPHASGCLIKTDGYSPSHAGTVICFSHGFVAHFEDTEGNRVGLHSR